MDRIRITIGSRPRRRKPVPPPTAEAVATFTAAIGAGKSYLAALAGAGITERTAARWVVQGQGVGPIDPLCREFRTLVLDTLIPPQLRRP